MNKLEKLAALIQGREVGTIGYIPRSMATRYPLYTGNRPLTNAERLRYYIVKRDALKARQGLNDRR